jgi:hypothetical protein
MWIGEHISVRINKLYVDSTPKILKPWFDISSFVFVSEEPNKIPAVVSVTLQIQRQ